MVARGARILDLPKRYELRFFPLLPEVQRTQDCLPLLQGEDPQQLAAVVPLPLFAERQSAVFLTHLPFLECDERIAVLLGKAQGGPSLHTERNKQIFRPARLSDAPQRTECTVPAAFPHFPTQIPKHIPRRFPDLRCAKERCLLLPLEDLFCKRFFRGLLFFNILFPFCKIAVVFGAIRFDDHLPLLQAKLFDQIGDHRLGDKVGMKIDLRPCPIVDLHPAARIIIVGFAAPQRHGKIALPRQLVVIVVAALGIERRNGR